MNHRRGGLESINKGDIMVIHSELKMPAGLDDEQGLAWLDRRIAGLEPVTFPVILIDGEMPGHTLESMQDMIDYRNGWAEGIDEEN
jgi:hypothetical protein